MDREVRRDVRCRIRGRPGREVRGNAAARQLTDMVGREGDAEGSKNKKIPLFLPLRGEMPA